MHMDYYISKIIKLEEHNKELIHKIFKNKQLLKEKDDIIKDYLEFIKDKLDNIETLEYRIEYLYSENIKLNNLCNNKELEIDKLKKELYLLKKEFNDYKEFKEKEFNDYKKFKEKEFINFKKELLLEKQYDDMIFFINIFLSDLNSNLNNILKQYKVIRKLIKKRHMDCHTFDKEVYKSDNNYRDYVNYKFIDFFKNLNDDVKFIINKQNPNDYDDILKFLIQHLQYNEIIITYDDIDNIFDEYLDE